jgi:hypothetical protein
LSCTRGSWHITQRTTVSSSSSSDSASSPSSTAEESKLGAVLNADDDVAAKTETATGDVHGGKVDAGTSNTATSAADEEGPRLLGSGGNGELPAPVTPGGNEASTNIDILLLLSVVEGSLLF